MRIAKSRIGSGKTVGKARGEKFTAVEKHVADSNGRFALTHDSESPRILADAALELERQHGRKITELAGEAGVAARFVEVMISRKPPGV
jgi:hypothetical protein